MFEKTCVHCATNALGMQEAHDERGLSLQGCHAPVLKQQQQSPKSAPGQKADSFRNNGISLKS